MSLVELLFVVPPGREERRYSKLGSFLISPIMSFMAWRSSLVISSSLREMEDEAEKIVLDLGMEGSLS